MTKEDKREYDKKYSLKNKRRKKENNRKYYLKNREELIKETRKYYLENKKKCRENRRNRFKKRYHSDDIFVKKQRARVSLRNCVYSGKVKRIYVCQKCKSRDGVESHHPNYDFPLRVKWLCRVCHRALHNKMKKNFIKQNINQKNIE